MHFWFKKFSSQLDSTNKVSVADISIKKKQKPTQTHVNFPMALLLLQKKFGRSGWDFFFWVDSAGTLVQKIYWFPCIAIGFFSGYLNFESRVVSHRYPNSGTIRQKAISQIISTPNCVTPPR